MHHVVVHNKFTTVIFHHHAIGKRVPMNKGGVMVKWLLPWFIRIFKSSAPSPSISSTSSTNVGNNYSKQHNKAENKSALKILI